MESAPHHSLHRRRGHSTEVWQQIATPQLVSHLPEQRTKSVLPGSIQSIAPVRVIVRVLDQLSVLGLEQQMVEMLVLGELLAQGPQHDGLLD